MFPCFLTRREYTRDIMYMWKVGGVELISACSRIICPWHCTYLQVWPHALLLPPSARLIPLWHTLRLQHVHGHANITCLCMYWQYCISTLSTVSCDPAIEWMSDWWIPASSAKIKVHLNRRYPPTRWQVISWKNYNFNGSDTKWDELSCRSFHNMCW